MRLLGATGVKTQLGWVGAKRGLLEGWNRLSGVEPGVSGRQGVVEKRGDTGQRWKLSAWEKGVSQAHGGGSSRAVRAQGLWVGGPCRRAGRGVLGRAPPATAPRDWVMGREGDPTWDPKTGPGASQGQTPTPAAAMMDDEPLLCGFRPRPRPGPRAPGTPVEPLSGNAAEPAGSARPAPPGPARPSPVRSHRPSASAALPSERKVSRGEAPASSPLPLAPGRPVRSLPAVPLARGGRARPIAFRAARGACREL